VWKNFKIASLNSKWRNRNERTTAGRSTGKKKAVDSEAGEETSQRGPVEPGPQDVFHSSNANWWEGGEKVKATQSFAPRKLDTPLDKMTRRL
jgi:hypothetical protein